MEANERWRKTVEKKDGTSDMGKRKDERNIIGRKGNKENKC